MMDKRDEILLRFELVAQVLFAKDWSGHDLSDLKDIIDQWEESLLITAEQ